MAKIGTVVLVAALALLLIGPATAEDSVDAATKAAIQDVIRKQLDAFAHDDAKAAQSFATPAIREKFTEPDKFFAMVKKNYAPLVHPKSTQFGDMSTSPHGPLQTMTVIADDGTVWTAIYSMQKVDGNWRISGCGLQKEEGQQAI